MRRWDIPAALRHQTAWAVWRYTQDAAGRWSKPPSQPDGAPADGRDDNTWSTFDACWGAYVHGEWDGLSFCVDPRWGLVGVDLDHVSLHQPDAQRIVDTLDSYAERSPGGDGLRVFVRGYLPEGRRRREWVEMYDHHRFLSVTGQRVSPHDAPQHRVHELHVVWRNWLQRG